MVGLLRVLQGELRATAPAVGFRAKVSDLDHGATQKARHGGRDFLCSHAVDGSVALVAPGEGIYVLQENEGDQRQADQPSSKPLGLHFTPPMLSAVPFSSHHVRTSDAPTAVRIGCCQRSAGSLRNC